MLQYKIIASDGREFGPVDVETVKRWFLERRISADTMTQDLQAGVWRRLADTFRLEDWEPPVQSTIQTRVVSLQAHPLTPKPVPVIESNGNAAAQKPVSKNAPTKSLVQKCAKCGLLSPPEALRCDCGYDFASGSIFESYLPPTKPEGIGRLAYIASLLGILIMANVLARILQNADVAFIVGLLTLVPTSLRLKNIGWHPAWCFVSLIPFVSLFVTIPCFLFPANYEKHGKIDSAAKAFLVGVSLLVLIMIVILVGYALFQ